MNKFQRWKGIMKCYPFEEGRLAKWQPPYIVQPKYDGVRCRAVPLDNGDFLLLSSEENPIFSVPHINEELKNLPHIEYDGELYTHGMSFEQIVSITSRTVNLHYMHEMVRYHIFDVVDQGPQHSRLSTLYALKNDIRKFPHLELSPFWMADNLEDIMRVYDKLIKMKYEGIIVRHCEGPYERKRSLWIMKWKPKKEDEYEIVGSKEEISITGTPKGTLGALVLRSGDGSTFQVGTGFTQEQREKLWETDLVGKVVKIKYQHLTDRKVPRFPVFVEVVE